MLSGHDFLLHHDNIINKDRHLINTNCRLCNEDRETGAHLMFDCDALWQTRESIFGTRKLKDYEPWTAEQAIEFFLAIDIENIDIPEEYFTT